jgi:hypothetical protein
MLILIEIAVVLLVVGGGWTYLNRNKRNAKREALTLRRVDAYIETIRRERKNAELAAMSDSELRDLLHAGATNLKIAEQRRNLAVTGIGLVTIIVAAALGSQEGWLPFLASGAVGALVAYGTSVYLSRSAKAPLEKRGIDVDRLQVM